MKAPAAKKSLGQNFLIDQMVIAKIVEAVPENTPLLLEIGPGQGAITYKVFERAREFCVLEKDDFLVESIRRELTGVGRGSHVWHGDALDFAFDTIWERTRLDTSVPLTVVGNLPYNVATEILLRLLKIAPHIDRMILMFQKEVGERLAGQPGSKAYSSLSILAQNWFLIKKLLLIRPGAFKPAPKVDSVVLEFLRRPSSLVDLRNPERYLRFEKILRAAFGHRRKTLENSLKINYSSIAWKDILSRAGIDGGRRAETLTIAEFKLLLEEVERA